MKTAPFALIAVVLAISCPAQKVDKFKTPQEVVAAMEVHLCMGAKGVPRFTADQKSKLTAIFVNCDAEVKARMKTRPTDTTDRFAYERWNKEQLEWGRRKRTEIIGLIRRLLTPPQLQAFDKDSDEILKRSGF
jgi:hypothetical protein